jgi:uncharacterized membrane protein YedE/YeeE
MMIDWTHFTPLASAIGGLVIGAAAAMLILFCGRVAGISGILGGVLSRTNKDKGWRVAFLLGMILSPLLWRLVAPLPAVSIDGVLAHADRSWPSCGSRDALRFRLYQRPRCVRLSRLSVRSLVATLVFMAAAFITVWLVGFWRG